MELPTPVSINASCMRVDGGSVDVDGPGMLYTSRDNGSTWDAGTTAEYYQAVDVAFGLRPYISEENGTLLLLADAALVSELRSASAAEQASVSVAIALPFATQPSAQTVTWRGGKMLQRAETVLSFPLASLPVKLDRLHDHSLYSVSNTLALFPVDGQSGRRHRDLAAELSEDQEAQAADACTAAACGLFCAARSGRPLDPQPERRRAPVQWRR